MCAWQPVRGRTDLALKWRVPSQRQSRCKATQSARSVGEQARLRGSSSQNALGGCRRGGALLLFVVDVARDSIAVVFRESKEPAPHEEAPARDVRGRYDFDLHLERDFARHVEREAQD